MQEPENSAAAPARQLDPAQQQALIERVDALAESRPGPSWRRPWRPSTATS